MSAVSTPTPMISASISSMGCVPLRGACFSCCRRAFLNHLDLVANELQPRHIAAQLRARIRRQWFIFWAAQYRETVACLAQLDVEGANAKPDQRRLHPVHDTGSLLHQS